MHLPEELRVEGNGYVLRGSESHIFIFASSSKLKSTERKPWDYGKTLNLAWGTKSIQPCPDKWSFIFEVASFNVESNPQLEN